MELQNLDTNALLDLIEEAQGIIDSRKTEPAEVRCAVHFSSYNEKRYGRPWIGRVVDWPVGQNPTMVFGAYLGDHSNGGAGEAEVMAKVGDIVRWGQKDFRGNNTESNWGVVLEGGVINQESMAAARKEYRG